MRNRPEIDGLRAVAIIPVVCYHAGLPAFGGGFVGVDVFFVISGYLITSILLTEIENRTFSLATFYERRARRILPALFLVLLCSLPFAYLWLPPQLTTDFAWSIIATVLFASNLLYWTEAGYFAPAADTMPLLHTWSLAIEEQYYIVFPLLLLALWRLGRDCALVVIALLAAGSFLFADWALRSQAVSEGTAFYLTPARAWELLAGSLCAFLGTAHTLKSSNLLSVVGLAMIGISVLFYHGGVPFPGAFALLPVLGTSLVILFSGSQTLVGRFLSTRPLVKIGLISYSAYLWHQPIFAFARLRSYSEPALWLMTLLALLSFGLALLSWRFVERPFRGHPAPLLPKRKSLYEIAGAVAVGLLAFGTAGAASKGALVSYSEPPRYLSEALSSDWTDNRCLPAYDEFDLNFLLQRCSTTTGNRSRVVLLGDSHASQYAHVLHQGAASVGYDFFQLTVRGCLPFEGLSTGGRACDEFAHEARRALAELDPNLIILSGRWTSYLTGRNFDNGEGGVEPESSPFVVGQLTPGSVEYTNEISRLFTRGISGYAGARAKILLIYPTPELGWNVPVLYSKIWQFGGQDASAIKISTSYEAFFERNKIAFDLLDSVEVPGVLRFRPDAILCDAIIVDRCVGAAGERIFYFDEDHLSLVGADAVSGPLMQLIGDTLPH